MLKPALLLMIFLVIQSAIISASAAPPDAGALLQQNQPVKPPQPSSGDTGLVIAPEPLSSVPASAAFMVTRIDIVGNTVFESGILHALVADAEGRKLTLNELVNVVANISDYYHLHGYPLARAFIPAQTMHDGVVQVQVLEAHYGQVSLNNSSLANDEVLNSVLANLVGGSQVQQTQLDRTLLLLSDIPGVTTTAIIKPGDQVGTSDLLIDAKATPAWNASLLFDDYGNRYTGRARHSGTVEWIDPFSSGDTLNLNALTTGKNMNSLGLSYETQLSGQGARIGGELSALHYILGDSLSAIGGHGTAETAGLWMKYPWQRSTTVNVYTQLEYNYKKLNDAIDSTGIHTDRHVNSVTLSLSGDVRDNFLAGAVTTWSVAWKAGELNFDNAAAQSLDASSAQTQGGFVKWNANYARLQNLFDDTQLYLALASQWANNNLDSSDKMVAGGPDTVRAYDMGAVSGDSGILANLELRQHLSDIGGHWQAIAFVDGEHVSINRSPWTADVNRVKLAGPGLGLNWNNESGWHAKIMVAAPMGSAPALTGEGKKVRGWAEIGSFF